MSDDKFKLPRSSFDELVKIIRGYGQFDKPVSLDDVSKVTSINSTGVSANAGFLVVSGILENGSKKQLTEPGRELARALDHEMPDEMRRAWQTIIHNCEFLNRLISAIRIRKGMDESTFQAHIAYSAGQPKKSQFMTGAKTVVDILRASELIRESEGKLIAGAVNNLDDPIGTKFHTDNPEETKPSAHPNDTNNEAMQVFSTTCGSGNIQIKIQLNIECRPDELSGLGEKIKAVVDELAGNPT